MHHAVVCVAFFALLRLHAHCDMPLLLHLSFGRGSWIADIACLHPPFRLTCRPTSCFSTRTSKRSNY